MEQTNSKPKSKVNKKIILFFLFGILLLGIISQVRNYLIEKTGVYTLATVYKVDHAGRGGGVRVYYYVDYKGKRYKDSYIDYETIGMNDIGKHFFTKILPNFPSEGLVYPEILIPEGVTVSPPEGWKELPIVAPTR